MRPVLILRPEPGASATARSARELGLRSVVAPLFAVRALAWDPPEPSMFDAVLFTSANAARHAGAALARYRHLRAFAVGAATAAAARDAGFVDVTAGTRDAERLVADIDPRLRVLHLCGRHRRAPWGALHEVSVYTSDALGTLPPAADAALSASAVILLHSPRAASLFAALVDERRKTSALVAISAAAAAAAGPGWGAIAAAPEPTDTAMLAIARILCENDPP